MNAIADIARANALQVEAKKHALRQQQDGCWILTLKVHQHDMPQEIMTAAMGARYVMALVEIGDDEQPLQPHPAVAAPRPVPMATQPPPAGETKCVVAAYGGSHCVGRCKEPRDCSEKPIPSGADKERRSFASLPYAQQAGMRCNEPVFWAFLRESLDAPGVTDKDLARATVCGLCQVDSRSEIKEGSKAAGRWRWIESSYQAWQAKERAA